MVILAIDTTTRGGSVAVTRDDEGLSLVGGDETRTHGERMPGEIARALEEAGVSTSDIDLIAVAAGPGAFTGLRIGLAAAQGLSLTLDRPVVGVSALDALAWTILDANGCVDDKPEGLSPPASVESVSPQDSHLSPRASVESGSPQDSHLSPRASVESGSWRQTFRFVEQRGGNIYIAPWMDAQRGDVFAALYRLSRSGVPPENALGNRGDQSWLPWTMIDQAVSARPRVVLDSWRSSIGDANALFVGDAVSRDQALIAQAGGGRWRTQLPDPLAPAIASIGRRLALEGRAGRLHLLAPIYVRRPDAEIERERRRPS